MAGGSQTYINRVLEALKKYCSDIKEIIENAIKGFDKANIQFIIDCFDGKVQTYAIDCYNKAKSLVA
jgi:type III secretory pathway lipoprotein EscJ